MSTTKSYFWLFLSSNGWLMHNPNGKKNFPLYPDGIFMHGWIVKWGLIILQVHGGSIGIGTFAIQIAKYRGARVFVTAGLPSLFYLISWHQFLVFTCFRPFFTTENEEKLAVCKDLWADVCINYKTEDFVAWVEETGGKGIFYCILTIISVEDGIAFNFLVHQIH